MSSHIYLLGIDVGTSSCKTVLFNSMGRVICTAAVEYPTLIEKDGWAEQEPETWWLSVSKTIGDVLKSSGVKPSDIAAVGIDSQGSAVVPLDEEFNPLGKAIIWMDRRSEPECRWIDKNVGQDLLTKINGNKNDSSNFGPKLRWIKQKEPERYKKTYKFSSAGGFLAHRLTDVLSFSITEGGLSQLFDIEKGVWSDELVKAFELDYEKLPEIYSPFHIIGKVTKRASKETGLLEGTPVIAGAMDATACALGCGVMGNNDTFISGGTVTCVGVCTGRPLRNPKFHSYHHIVPGNWIHAAGVDFGGGSYRWYRDNLLSSGNFENLSYELLDLEAEAAGVGANKLLFMPYMVGQRTPIWDNNTRGLFFGISPAHTRKHFTRAILEGNAYGVNFILKLFEEMGIRAANVKLTGGCSKGHVWREIFADVLAQNISIPTITEVTALGIAVTAGVGAGVYNSFDEALRNVKYEEVNCNSSNAEKYGKLYKVFSGLYPLLKDKLQELADI